MINKNEEVLSSLNPSDIRSIEPHGKNQYSVTYKDGSTETWVGEFNLVEAFEKELKNPLSDIEKPLVEMVEQMKESFSKEYKRPEIPGFYCEKCNEKVMEEDVTIKIQEPPEENEEDPKSLYRRPLKPALEIFLHMTCKKEVVELATRRNSRLAMYS